MTTKNANWQYAYFNLYSKVAKMLLNHNNEESKKELLRDWDDLRQNMPLPKLCNENVEYADNSCYDFNDGNGLVPAHKHSNGGGWVANTAYVENTAYVCSNAEVFGYAQVYGYACVFDNAKVYEYAVVYDDARVSGNAHVSGNSEVRDDARVFDNATVSGNAIVQDDARIYGNSYVSGNAKVRDSALVFDDAIVGGKAKVEGSAWVCGNATVSGSVWVSNDAVIAETKMLPYEKPELGTCDFAQALYYMQIGYKYNRKEYDKHIIKHIEFKDDKFWAVCPRDSKHYWVVKHRDLLAKDWYMVS